ncbi:hypothetical protein K456DRAFT_1905321, partial [Colletotrichum gloeosporioides 23]
RYKRLRLGEIRLLRLFHSEDGGSEIEGSLASFPLGNSPKYTAISYAWGDRRRVSNIRIDGELITITASLWHALAALRRRDQPVLIWVDALSINQHDIDELSHQVRIMDAIYSQADVVAACLGPPSEFDDSELAFDYLREISNTDGTNLVDWFMLEKQISSVVRLFDRNYWKRLWVMQEVFHANRVEVYCGSDSMPLDTVFAACKVFSKISGRIETCFPGGDVIQNSENHYSYAQALTTQGPNTLLNQSVGLPESPLDILRICRSKLAARPQDKILGVMSLLPEDIRKIFRLDFSFTPQEVFTEIVICVFLTSRSLDVICESIRYPFHQNPFGLSSWVPDWSHSPDTLSLASTHLSHRRPFQACSMGMSIELSSKQPVFSQDELRIHGIQVGTVTTRGMSVGTLGRLSDYLMAFLEWRHILLDDPHYRQRHQAAFCRTLCLGDDETASTGSRQIYQWQEVTFGIFAHFL